MRSLRSLVGICEKKNKHESFILQVQWSLHNYRTDWNGTCFHGWTSGSTEKSKSFKKIKWNLHFLPFLIIVNLQQVFNQPYFIENLITKLFSHLNFPTKVTFSTHSFIFFIYFFYFNMFPNSSTWRVSQSLFCELFWRISSIQFDSRYQKNKNSRSR